jgi:PadR family transcriptional regulator, regulatory protein PadR
MKHTNALLHGTLEALILKAVGDEPRHGYAIARWLEKATGNAIDIEDGSMYPALYRLEANGFIRSEWATSELGRRVKRYVITARGRRRLARETETWSRFADAITGVLLGRGRA